ncbi:hypothetical protein D3C77_530290 [compost metagenome]
MIANTLIILFPVDGGPPGVGVEAPPAYAKYHPPGTIASKVASRGALLVANPTEFNRFIADWNTPNAVIHLLLSTPPSAIGSEALSVMFNFPASAFVIVVAKFGSLPSAADSSLRVSNASGEDPISAARAAFTNAVLAA